MSAEDRRFRRRVTVGVIGAGEVVSKVHLPVLSAMSSRVSVEYVADISSRAASRAGKAYRCRAVDLGHGNAVFPTTDVALIAVPVGVRWRYYEMLAERTTAVLAEKPAALTTHDLDRLTEMFPRQLFAVGFQRRTYQSTALLRSLIQARLLGSLVDIRASEGSQTKGTGGAQSFIDDVSVSGGGILMDLGCHATDLAFHLTGAGSGNLMEADGVLDGQIDREVELHARFDAPLDTIDFRMSLSWLADRDGQFVLDFENGRAVVGTKPDALVSLADHNGSEVATLNRGRGVARGATTIHQACFLVWKSFLDGLEGRSEPFLTLESARPTVSLIETAYRGIRGSL